MPATALPSIGSGRSAADWRSRLRVFCEALFTRLRAARAGESSADVPWPEPRRAGGAERARFIDLPGGTVLRQPAVFERRERW